MIIFFEVAPYMYTIRTLLCMDHFPLPPIKRNLEIEVNNYKIGVKPTRKHKIQAFITSDPLTEN